MDYEQALQIIADMKSGKINWDDNLLSAANNAVRGSTGGGGGFGVNVPAFSFDYPKAEAEALKELEPYYKQKLAEAQGDVDRAKRLIEEDYARGIRTRTEDTEVERRQDQMLAREENLDTQGSLNNRGVLFGQITDPNSSKAPYSLFAQENFLNPLSEKQALRRQAIERALSRQNEVAGIERKRGIEEQDIAFPRFQRALEQEKLDKARMQIVPYKQQQAYSKYQASTNPYMQGNQL